MVDWRRQVHRRHIQLADAADELIADPTLDVDMTGCAEHGRPVAA